MVRGAMITTAHRMESLSRAYLQAVAARAGPSFAFRVYDYGVDITLGEVREVGGVYAETGFALDIQLRASTLAAVRVEEVAFDLDVRTYDLLRREEVATTRILVLLVLPPDEGEWGRQTEAALELRRCAYWLSLRGQPPTVNTSSVRVVIPRANVFGVTAVRAMFERLHRGEQL
jgi:hypothetical protein